jgi:hypothetical protein
MNPTTSSTEIKFSGCTLGNICTWLWVVPALQCLSVDVDQLRQAQTSAPGQSPRAVSSRQAATSRSSVCSSAGVSDEVGPQGDGLT